MKTEIQMTELYKEFKTVLAIGTEMRIEDNPYIVDCCKVADNRAIYFGIWLSKNCSDKYYDFNAPLGSMYYFFEGTHLKTIEELYELFTLKTDNHG